MPDAAKTNAKNENVNAYFINGYCFTLSITLYIIILIKIIDLEI